MKGTFGGYGRYDDDPLKVGCPRAKSDMTPCVARDGQLAQTTPHYGVCVGCGENPADLLTALVKEITESLAPPDPNQPGVGSPA